MAKIPLVLVPGLLCHDDLWRPQIEGLSDIAEISVGDTRQDASISGMAERILKASPDHFALAGLSMGGYVCMEIMCQAPERVERLALLDTTGRADSAHQNKRRKGLIELATIGKFKGVTPRLMPSLIHVGRQNDTVLTSYIVDMASRVGQQGFLRQQMAIMNRRAQLEGMKAYDLPVMILCGRDDVLTPLELHEEMADVIPAAKLCIVEECGHLSTLEQPNVVTALLRDWLLWN